YTKIVENSDETALFDEVFEWPVARPVEAEEIIDIQVYNYNKYLSNRLIGTFRMILQELIEVGSVKISDSLLDANNVVMKTTITFELTYNAPDGSVGHWQKGGFEKLTSDDLRRPLSEDERNQLSLDRSSALGDSESVMSDMSKSLKDSRLSIASRTSSVVKKVIKKEVLADDSQLLIDPEELGKLMSGTGCEIISDASLTTNFFIFFRKKQKPLFDSISLNKSQDFQVCITIIEARQLAGLNMDPVVCCQVGDNKKYTSVKESTNCPYYNEYFVFDFHLPAVMLFDKIITLTVLHSRNFLRSGTEIGRFKIDVATVYLAADHQFYHKWAMLTDPDDLGSGVKGYLKCDISVIGKGDSVKVPPKTDKDEDDIEGNLLLPDGVPADRQRAKFYVKIYKAEGLPKMNAGLVANVKKAFTGESNDLVDPYVEVGFAGQKGRTSVKKGSYEPIWNEQIIFTEMFPPLCRRFRIQLRDKDSVNDHIIGTHFIDLSQISNEGEKGFLPTYGPCWVNLYGSTRYYQFMDEHTHLNDGLGEGVSYRGRIQVAIKTEIMDSTDTGPATVEVESTLPVADNAAGKPEEYFLFGCVMESTMIDKKMSDKSLHFEISIGNAGNVLDGYNCPTKDSKDSESDEEADSRSENEDPVEPGMSFSANIPKWMSTTGATKPVTKDKIYYHMPYYADKPCVYLKEQFEDHRRRLYNSNIIEKIIDKLDDGLQEVHDMIRQEIPFPERRLRGVFEELGHGCSRFVSLVKGSGGGASAGKTKLDRERHKILVRQMDQLSTLARTVKATITKNNLKEKMRSGNNCLSKLRKLKDEPQPSLPDVYIWMIASKKRIAYQRLSARDIIYSVVEEEKGKDCGKVVTLLLKLPGKKADGESGWTIQAKLQLYIWLGLLKHKKDYLKGLPMGYEETKALKHSTKTQAVPPPFIYFTEKQTFQLRAHMYQARQLIGSDASGLSDPFARIAFSEQSICTQVIEETLSPTWDEFLILNEVDVYGLIEDIVDNPPTIIVEVFDQDNVGKSEFIGRCLCKPVVKQSTEKYDPPKFPPRLEWWDITRGMDRAGELLAAFELLQLAPFGDRAGSDLPPMELPDLEKDRGPIMPVPKGIRPILSTHRIEVLFWGVRDLKRVQLQSVDHPRIDIECAGHVLQSAVILNCKKNPNFSIPVKFFDVELPENEHYCPPITIRCVDCRSFGRYVLVGTHVISSIHKFMFIPTTKKAKAALTRLFPGKWIQARVSGGAKFYKGAQLSINMDENLPLINKEQFITVDTLYLNFVEVDAKEAKEVKKMEKELKRLEKKELVEKKMTSAKAATLAKQLSPKSQRKKEQVLNNTAQLKIIKLKNWSKKSVDFFISNPEMMLNFHLFQVYPNELENQPEFEGFKDWLHTFELYRGKKSSMEESDENRIVGKFKGSLKIYKIPLPSDLEDTTITGGDPQYGLFQGLPSNDPIKVLVRVYVVKANDLHPADINGKADPYLVIRLGNSTVNDKDSYISKQLNPVFGKCFEIEATFPMESLLTVQIYDWDLVGMDDLIGETKLDLENRYYSRHRATCGLAQKYEIHGYNAWRDPLKPGHILAKLCKDSKVDGPYYQPGKVRVGNRIFTAATEVEDENGIKKQTDEHLALAALNHWDEIPKVGCKLVPEHVETRPLYHPEKVGIEQGKVELWVDMFPMDMPAPAPPVDISPRKPKSYELRCIIWNTDDVVLEDDAFFSGEKMSDIYVKGWIKGPEDMQSTDIHYRSLTGEGNFNWRFLFPFDYLVAEEKIVISRKETLFSWDETESKIPARLNLQVWDADHFSADDFLGSLTLDLNRFPRGAKSSKLCTLDMLKTDGTVPQMSLFKHKRVKGWWPFAVKNQETNDELELTGKVEAELQLISAEEAEKHPAGQGRNEPDPLDKPNRPDSSFMWFMNPWKSIRYILWHNYKWVILKLLIVLLLTILLVLFFYSMPGYTVKRLFGA
ncbi:hypothetical protein LOTGIDRAFT_125029, partial [Lottia gigantea]